MLLLPGIFYNRQPVNHCQWICKHGEVRALVQVLDTHMDKLYASSLFPDKREYGKVKTMAEMLKANADKLDNKTMAEMLRANADKLDNKSMAEMLRANADKLDHIIIGFLINVQVQGHHPHQWAPFQVTG